MERNKIVEILNLLHQKSEDWKPINQEKENYCTVRKVYKAFNQQLNIRVNLFCVLCVIQADCAAVAWMTPGMPEMEMTAWELRNNVEVGDVLVFFIPLFCYICALQHHNRLRLTGWTPTGTAC